MRIEQGTPVPQPDIVIFEYDDYLPHVPPFCYHCLKAFQNSNFPVHLGNRHHGLSKDCLGKQIVFPNGTGFNVWSEGMAIPPGWDFITEMVRIFGMQFDLRTPNGFLPLFAVTSVNGTACCALDAVLEGGKK